MRLRLITAIAGALLLVSGGSAGAASFYLPSYGEHDPEAINGYARAPDGSPSPLPGSPFPVGPPGPMPAVIGFIGFAFTPDGGKGVASFFFKPGGVVGLTIAGNGAVTPVPAPILTPSATNVAVSPDGRFAYVTTRSFMAVKGEGIIGYSIGADGALSALSTSPFGSTDDYNDVAITPDGRFLFAVIGLDVERFAVGADGSLTSMGTADVKSARSLAVSPDGRFLFVTQDGGEIDSVVSLSIGAGGGLTENGSPVPTGDNGLGLIAVSPDGSRIYMPDRELDAIVTASVAADGTLTALGSPAPVNNASTLAASPDGRFLYYGYDSVMDGHVGVASIGADGLPTLLPFTAPWDTGNVLLRIQFQPGPAPVASFLTKRGAPGELSGFNALGSAGAARYDWDFGDGITLLDGGPTPTHRYQSAGVYQVRLTVSDERGCSTRQIYTGQSTTCPGGPSATTTAALDTLPAITALSVTNRKFAVGPTKAKAKRDAATSSVKAKTGTAFRYTLTEKARVKFTIARRRSGRMVGGKCRPKTRANNERKRCALFKKAGVLNAAGRKGRNRNTFTGKLRGRALAPGPYKATAVATDSAKGRSTPTWVSFKIIATRTDGRRGP